MAIKVGGTTVVDDSRALTNIASVDATTVAALGAAGVGGGGTLDFVASGTLSDGSAVTLNSDGTVSVISGVSNSIGTPVAYSNHYSFTNSGVFDSFNNKVVVVYKDDTSGGFGYAIVGTVSGTSISFGTPVVFESGECGTSVCAAFDSTNNKVVIAYMDVTNSHNYTAIVGTVSGTSISFGTAVVFDTQPAGSSYLDIVYDSNAGKVVIGFRDNNRYVAEPSAIVGTVSGTSISFGTKVDIPSSSSSNALHLAGTFDSLNNKVVFGHRDATAGQVYASVGTVSGTSISFGTKASMSSLAIDELSATFDSFQNKVVFAFYNGSAPKDGTAIVATVSGTSISFGNPVTFYSGTMEGMTSCFDVSAKKTIIYYKDGADGSTLKVVFGTISGTGISFEPALQIGTVSGINVTTHGAVYDSNANKSIVLFWDAPSYYGFAAVTQVNSSTLNSDNFIGFSDGAYTNGQTATVQVVGAVDDAQSSLTAGKKYYVQNDGTLSELPGTINVYAGLATSSTELLVKG